MTKTAIMAGAALLALFAVGLALALGRGGTKVEQVVSTVSPAAPAANQLTTPGIPRMKPVAEDAEGNGQDQQDGDGRSDDGGDDRAGGDDQAGDDVGGNQP